MSNKSVKKIKSLTIIFLIIFLQNCFINEVSADTNLNYNNPNTNGSSPYKINVQNASNLTTAVIGCTGIINKVSKATNLLVSKATNKATDEVLSIESVATDSEGTQRRIDAANAQLKEDAQREECFNGIAYTLAKNQLTAMTKATMNWVNTGLQGNPLYVENQNTFLGRLNSAIIQRESSWFGYNTTLFPYGRSYSRGLVTGQMFAQNFQQSLESNLINYIANGSTTQSYANNFSQGGWNGWLGLTQNPQNNPLGFTIKASDKVGNDITKAATDLVNEQNRGNGILDQKKCKATKSQQSVASNAPQELKDAQDNYDQAQKAYTDAFNAYTNDINNSDKHKAALTFKKNLDDAQARLSAAQGNYNANYSADGQQNCTEWETVTPGSVIQDKVSTYINSPERQLELANTINQSLNALFTALINKFQGDGGLKSLSTSASNFSNSSTINSSTNNSSSSDFGTGFTGSVDLTKDLKKIIQTQKDYVVVANDGLKVMPDVVPAVGKLDWCIPGPNPNWEQNSQPAKEAYLDWINNVSTVYVQAHTPQWATITANIFDPLHIFGSHTADTSFFTLKTPDYSTYGSLMRAGSWPDWNVINGTGDPNVDYFYVGADGEVTTQEHIDDFVTHWTSFSDAWSNAYNIKYGQTYGIGSPMQTEFNADLTNNSSFLPMAQAGLNITKDLVSDAENIATAMDDYKNGVATANSNIYKLNQIKAEVDPIVKAAQCRRAEKRKNAGLEEIPIGLNCNACIRSVASDGFVNFNCAAVNYDPAFVVKDDDNICQ